MTYYDIEGNETTLYKLIRSEPDWAESRIKMGEKLADMYTELARQLAETQHALAMEKSGRSGEVCDMCNFIERADCVDQKDELRNRIAEKDAEIERLTKQAACTYHHAPFMAICVECGWIPKVD